ncbi:hypothetical protein V1477_020837 [Vespula maculifrons]|uniref:Uncharacterized protein n=1 Tax=Vespula maculifrons TaxID=7453 RepID=A0ABD2ANX9_VESMC
MTSVHGVSSLRIITDFQEFCKLQYREPNIPVIHLLYNQEIYYICINNWVSVCSYLQVSQCITEDGREINNFIYEIKLIIIMIVPYQFKMLSYFIFNLFGYQLHFQLPTDHPA